MLPKTAPTAAGLILAADLPDAITAAAAEAAIASHRFDAAPCEVCDGIADDRCGECGAHACRACLELGLCPDCLEEAEPDPTYSSDR